MKKQIGRKVLSLMLGLTLTLSLAGCAANSSGTGADQASESDTAQAASGGAQADDARDAASEAQAGDTEKDDAEIRNLISEMTVEEKLTQMMIVALRSDGANADTATGIDEDYADLLQKHDFGGIILFAGNITDPAQTVTLIRDCQDAAISSAHGIPMFICVDQEGGAVNRVGFGTTGSGNMALAATGDPALAQESARMMGDEIYALGFNMDFAPVSDVNSNPANPVIGVRSFSDDPQIAADYVTSFIKGLDASNISAALKHFPGHGNVGEDSPVRILTSRRSKTVISFPSRRVLTRART